MEVAGAIEPGLIVEPGDIDDERVAVPLRHRLTHPRIDRGWPGILQVNVADGARIFVRDQQLTRTLDDLKRIRHVGRPRDAGQIALDLRIARQPLLLVLLLRLQRVGLVRKLVAVDDAHARRYGTNRTECDLSLIHISEPTRLLSI